jgi:hypothetical protein
MSTDRIREIVGSDLDPDFIRDVAVRMAWEYNSLYETLAGSAELIDPLRNEEFAKRRGLCAIRAMAASAATHGVPFEFHRLECNGQRKILVKTGRVVLIQEPMLTLTDSPRTSEYKRERADAHGFVRQLQLDLGDQPHRVRDWSGTALAVLLHGAAGPEFTRDHKTLGGLLLGVPDAAYEHWTMRLDFLSIAMFGAGEISPDKPKRTYETEIQRDEVHVPLRERKTKMGKAE